MDDALKARLIGAAVLVALAVILIPELLSGRKSSEPGAASPPGDRGTRSFTIELGGGSAQTTVTPSAGNTSPTARDAAPQVAAPAAAPAAREQVSEAPKSEERIAEVQPPRTKPDVGPARAADEPKAAGAAAGPPVPEPIAATRAAADTEPPPQEATATAGRVGWAVQVGAFGSVTAANKLVSQLQGAGYRAYVSPVTRNGKTLHRVRVGPESDRAAAEKLVAGLKARGLPTSVVASD